MSETTEMFALELRGITKRFGKNVANEKVDLKVKKGSVHALVGENGAGKSTLMKVAYGQIRPDEGKMYLEGKELVGKHSPGRAIDVGLGMVHQHFMLVPPLTVAENVMLGREEVKGGFLDTAKVSAELSELSRKYGLHVDPQARVEDLSVGQQQRVEIVKVLWQGCKVLILDEPTAVLTPLEVEQLFEVLRELVAGGMSVIIITHKLDEVVAIADEITVMRRGKKVSELDGHAASVTDIAQAMVGRSVLLRVDKEPANAGDEVLSIKELKVKRPSGLWAIESFNLSLRAGEIVGIAGVEGNGQSELQECILGFRKPDAGTIALGPEILNSESGDFLSVAERYRAGLAHVPEDRHDRAMILSFSIEENILLGRQGQFSGRLAIDGSALEEEVSDCIENYDVRPTAPETLGGAMSGGNQQKVVIARELRRPGNRLLICAQPTRGVDIGAIEMIHREVIRARDEGLAVLLFSAELSELEALSDRLLVMYGGKVSLEMGQGELAAAGARARIGAAMTGGNVNSAATPEASASDTKVSS